MQPSSGQRDLFHVVAIGASAGGLTALRQFLAEVSNDGGIAYVVIVHLSPEHESHLQEILQPHAKIPVQQVTSDTKLERNHVYIIPPNANLDVIDSRLCVTHLETRRDARGPIDHFFRTLADTHNGLAIGVVLSGSGSDGALGLRRIKERGGLAIVQEPREAEYDGMPKSAIAAAPVDLVLPVAQIPEAIVRFARTEPRLAMSDAERDTGDPTHGFLQKVIPLLQARAGRDFRHYRGSTLLRRIARRMQFKNVREPDAYLDLLRASHDEARALADDVLINVTSFFRDPAVFESLEGIVLPQLFDGNGRKESVRAWSVGCATGEEACTLAILLFEEAARRGSAAAIRVFATDLHKGSIDTAREGVYVGRIEADVRPDRLARFFLAEPKGYRVRQEVRERIIFAQHDILRDPPYSRLDLISCRNLLIYLNRDVHGLLAQIFHYALKPGGYLLLGPSESLDDSNLFAVVDKKRGLYRKLNVVSAVPRLPVFAVAHQRSADPAPFLPARSATDTQSMTAGGVQRRMVEQYAPPSVLKDTPRDDGPALGRPGPRHLETIIRDHEIAQEELRASNEELQSANEELRCALEELEASKEELQSVNEELQTVNQENRHKVEELGVISSDLVNLLAATEIATIFLDRELRILRFTPKAGDLFSVQSADRGRPLSDLTHRLHDGGLQDDARQVLRLLVPIDREIQDIAGRWYQMRILPYRDIEDRIAGVVVTFVDVTLHKSMEADLRHAVEYSEHIIETLPEPILVLSAELTVESANAAFYEHFAARAEDTKGRKVYDLGNGQWNIPALRELLENILPRQEVFNGYEVDHVFESLGRRVMLVNGRQLKHMNLILLGISDITARRESEKELEALNRRLLEEERRRSVP